MFKQYVIGWGLLGLTLQAGNTMSCIRATEADAARGAAQAGQEILPKIKTFGQEAGPVLESGIEDTAKYALTNLIDLGIKNAQVQELGQMLHVSISEDANGLFTFTRYGEELGTWQGIANSGVLISKLLTGTAAAIVATKAASSSGAASSQAAGAIASSSASSSPSAASSSQ